MKHITKNFDTGFVPPEYVKNVPEETTIVKNIRFETKDSGKREEYKSGMRRDTQEGKANFYLTLALDVPFNEQMLTRWADLMTRGANKYGDRNWEKSATEEEMERFKASAMRHFVQWITEEDDEDHASAVFFNITAVERLKWKMK